MRSHTRRVTQAVRCSKAGREPAKHRVMRDGMARAASGSTAADAESAQCEVQDDAGGDRYQQEIVVGAYPVIAARRRAQPIMAVVAYHIGRPVVAVAAYPA